MKLVVVKRNFQVLLVPNYHDICYIDLKQDLLLKKNKNLITKLLDKRWKMAIFKNSLGAVFIF